MAELFHKLLTSSVRSLPPGPAFLLRISAISIPPRLLTYVLLKYIAGSLGLALPTWLVVVAVIISTPVLLFVLSIRTQRKIRRAAERMGATLPPQWQGRWPLNLDLMRQFMDVFLNGYPGDLLIDKLEEMGPTLSVKILGATEYVTCDPAAIKEELATNFTGFVKGEYFYQIMHSVLGTGVFNSDGERWKFHRAMTRPFFSRERIGDFDIFDAHAEAALATLRARLRSGQAVDFQELVSRFTLDSATQFLFGACVHSMRTLLPYPHGVLPSSRAGSEALADESGPEVLGARAKEFADAFAAAQHGVAQRARRGWIWPLFEFWGLKTDRPMQVVDAFLTPILEEALAKEWKRRELGSGDKVAADSIDEEGVTLLDHLVRLTDDPTVLHDEVLNILIAGRDTTAASLTFAVYFLSQYPNVLSRLREEIMEKVGPTRRPTYEDIREMKYLRAVLNETLRLYPAVPFNVRVTVEETTIPNSVPGGRPFYIPAKTGLSYSVFIMHRRTDLWGPDANEFDPDRFLDDRVSKYLTANPFIFLPFNAGPRICLGQQFAYNEMSLFLIRLLQQFSEITLSPESFAPGTLPPPNWAGAPGRKGVEKIRPKLHLTIYSNGGLWVKMEEADQRA